MCLSLSAIPCNPALGRCRGTQLYHLLVYVPVQARFTSLAITTQREYVGYILGGMQHYPSDVFRYGAQLPQSSLACFRIKQVRYGRAFTPRTSCCKIIPSQTLSAQCFKNPLKIPQLKYLVQSTRRCYVRYRKSGLESRGLRSLQTEEVQGK